MKVAVDAKVAQAKQLLASVTRNFDELLTVFGQLARYYVQYKETEQEQDQRPDEFHQTLLRGVNKHSEGLGRKIKDLAAYKATFLRIDEVIAKTTEEEMPGANENLEKVCAMLERSIADVIELRVSLEPKVERLRDYVMVYETSSEVGKVTIEAGGR